MSMLHKDDAVEPANFDAVTLTGCCKTASAVLLVAPQLIATLIGIAIMAPIAARQLMGERRSTA